MLMVAASGCAPAAVSAPANQPPVASAGADRPVHKGDSVQLDGSASTDPEGAALSFSWHQSGDSALLNQTNEAVAMITAPRLSGGVEYVLTVSDGDLTDDDTVIVTVENRPPVAGAGVDVSVAQGAGVVLDAAASQDPDGDPLVYQWTQTNGPAVVLVDGNSTSSSFVAPMAPAVLVFEVAIDDGEVTTTDQVGVTVLNQVPSARAGNDQTIVAGMPFSLDGSGSSDADGNSLTYAWRQTAGPLVVVANATAPELGLTAPTAPGLLEFELTVSDGFSSAPDRVSVSVGWPSPSCNGATGLGAPLPECSIDYACTRIAAELPQVQIENASDPPSCADARWTATREWLIGNTRRYACVYIPDTALSAPRPLVVFFHPGGEGADVVEQQTSLLTKAQSVQLSADPMRLGFGLVVVQGRNLHFPTANPRDGRHHDFYYRDLGSPSTNPDIQFADLAIDSLVSEGGIDTARIYVMGWSNGAFFSQLYATARHDVATPGGNRVAATTVFAAADPFQGVGLDPFLNVTPADPNACRLTTYPTSAVPVRLYFRTCDGATPCGSVDAACVGAEPGYVVSDWVAAAPSYLPNFQAQLVGGFELGAAGRDQPATMCTNFTCTTTMANICLVNHLRWPDGKYDCGAACSTGIDYEIPMLDFLRMNGGSPPAPTLQQRTDAATVTASQNAACTSITPFYWEIGDTNGLLASGSGGDGSTTPPNSTTVMSIASASKWIFSTYVVEKQSGMLSPTDIQFLNFQSGYANFNACSTTATVASCLSETGTLGGVTTNGDRFPTTVGRFFYNGGHMQVLANNIGLGPDQNVPLATDIRSIVGADVALFYIQPQLAGGAVTTPAYYAQFLRNLLGSARYPYMLSLLGSNAVCTNPNSGDCPSALLSPINQSGLGPDNDVTDERWHYSLGHWVEDDPIVGDGAFSSAGLFGFYPWIDKSKTYYGFVARLDAGNVAPADPRQASYITSIFCGRLIRKAWVLGMQQ